VLCALNGPIQKWRCIMGKKLWGRYDAIFIEPENVTTALALFILVELIPLHFSQVFSVIGEHDAGSDISKEAPGTSSSLSDIQICLHWQRWTPTNQPKLV
jgi:hypothetical protein